MLPNDIYLFIIIDEVYSVLLFILIFSQYNLRNDQMDMCVNQEMQINLWNKYKIYENNTLKTAKNLFLYLCLTYYLYCSILYEQQFSISFRESGGTSKWACWYVSSNINSSQNCHILIKFGQLILTFSGSVSKLSYFHACLIRFLHSDRLTGVSGQAH